MRHTATSAILALSVLLPSCDHRPLPTAPTTVAPPAAPPVTPVPPVTMPDLWDLTTVLTSVAGPDNCFSRGAQAHMGKPLAWLMSVKRSEGTVVFLYDVRNSVDYVEYSGTLDGGNFIATSGTMGARFPPCPDGTTLVGSADALVSGRFSGDGRHITGTETWTYRFPSGDVSASWEWTADQR